MSETGGAVTRGDGGHLLALADPGRIPFTAAYSLQDFERIKLGLRPREMEDKWFIFCENHVLYLHRSWTGHCIFRVRFREEGGRVEAVSAEVNLDREQYQRSDDAHDSELLGYLIDHFLLHRPVDFPLPPGMRNAGDA
jgi:hypothetical protein